MSEEQNGIKCENKLRMPRSSLPINERLCLICGDRALGYNFGAISCESCKAFFRRNALKNKISKCLFTHNCLIDVNTRRFCPDCRLQKCIQIGMKKELILGEEKKNMRKKSQRKQKSNTENDNLDAIDITNQNFEQLPLLHDMQTQQDISHTSTYNINNISSIEGSELTPNTPLVHLTNHAQIIENNGNNQQMFINNIGSDSLHGTQYSDSVLDTTLTSDIVTNKLETGVVGSFKELKPTNGNGLIQNNCQDLYRKLTMMEDKLINELVQIYDLSFTIDLEPLIHIRHLDPTLNQLVNQSSITVLRLIKFAKRLDEFAKLDQVCQIGMLKGCWIYILFLRSLSLYDCERDVWATPRGDIPTEILKNATGFVQLHDDHVRYCKSIKSIIGDDIVIVVVLIVIVLFSPEEVNVHGLARQAIADIQDKYLVLLKHYLESHYTYTSSAEMLPALMIKIKELKEFSEKHGRCLVDINPHEIEPIMLEILDLK